MILNKILEERKKIIFLFNNKKFNKVIKLGKALLRKSPNDFDLLNIMSLSSIKIENFEESKKYYKALLKIKQTPELYYNYGKILKKLNLFNEAIDAFHEAIKLNPIFAEAYNNLGNTQKLINEKQDAIKNYKKSIELKKENLEAYFNLANILKEEKNYNEAKIFYEKILNIDNKNFNAQNNLGAINSILGNLNLARDFFKKSIENNNLSFESYKNYIDITKISKDDEIFKKLEKITLKNLNDKNKIDINYSLSKGYFDQNKNEIGFTYLEKAKKLKTQQSNFSIKSQKKLFINIKKFFDKNYLNIINHNFKIKCKPIFIVGMPRSGTTLIEQILSSHSKIYGAGELDYMPKIMEKIKFEEVNSFEKTINRIRLEYNNKLIEISGKSYVTDKLPMNFKWIGFIIKAFPEAKIIHLERNPMAVCWSNYKINFNNIGMEFALNQKDIANYYILYNDLMKFWFNKFGNEIININYEKFVLNPEQNTKKIIGELNLLWEDNLKNHSKNERPIETASLHQARGKIFKNSSEQWKNYQNFLKPIQEIFSKNNINF